MNKRQAKKKRKIKAYIEEWNGLSLNEIKKKKRWLIAYYCSPRGKKEVLNKICRVN